MKIRFIVFTLCCLSIFSDFTIAAEPAKNNEPLIFGVFPRRSAQLTLKLFKPMANYLSKELGREVRLLTSKNFKTFWSGVKQKKYDIVHYNQYHYIVSHKQQGYDVIVKNEEFGRSTLRASILVRKDSGINTIADLKGKTIAFGGGPKAMIAYIVPTYLLRNSGLQKADYKEIFAKNPPNSLFSTYYKQTDAAGAGDIVMKLDLVNKQIDVNQMKLLIESDEIVHLPWAVNHNLPQELRENIKKALLKLNDTQKGKKILSAAKLTGLIDASDEEYNSQRVILKKVYDQSYD